MTHRVKKIAALAVLATTPFGLPAVAVESTSYQAQIESLQSQIDQLRSEIKTVDQAQDDNSGLLDRLLKQKESDDGIQIGGAVRFQYTNQGYDTGNVHREGDVAFDTFRLNLDGEVGDVILSAEWRWYSYMTTLHHAWVGYDFDENNQLQIGLTRIPFGNQAYNSHSFFFSSNYYLGLEDTYAFGVEHIFDNGTWNVQTAFFKNRARGVGGGPDNYSFDLVKDGAGNTAGTTNTGALRVARTFKPSNDIAIEVGASGLYGALNNGHHRIGHYGAYALHTDMQFGQLNVQAQATHYDYRFNNGADLMYLGAYATTYATPTSGHTYTFNVSWHQPVNWGPITSLDIYNDYSLITHKPGNAADTYMNDTGVGVSAGGVYAYIDYINARNQPFIGGNMAGLGTTEEVEHRFNLNIGYYF